MRLKSKAVNLIATLSPHQAGIAAKLVLTKPTNKTITKSVLTDPTGQATAQFALGPADKPGMYVGSVTITVNALAISDKTSLLVQ